MKFVDLQERVQWDGDTNRDWLDSEDLFHEDVETDLVDSTFLTKMVMQMDAYLRKQIEHPTYNADHMSVQFGRPPEQGYMFRGKQFGWVGAFADLYVIMLPVGGSDNATCSYFRNSSGDKYVITLHVLEDVDYNDHPDDTEISMGLKQLITDKWHGIILHELKHAQQMFRDQMPSGTKTSKMGNSEYYNHPLEFDAYYHQLARKYYTILHYLRTKPEVGLEMLNTVEFNKDFKKSIQHMLPQDVSDTTWGVWYYASDKQTKRMIKRLYGLHQAILKELEDMDNDKEKDVDVDEDIYNTGKAIGTTIGKATRIIPQPVRAVASRFIPYVGAGLTAMDAYDAGKWIVDHTGPITGDNQRKVRDVLSKDYNSNTDKPLSPNPKMGPSAHPEKISQLQPLESVTEDDKEHAQALSDTGYWGKAGAGCLVIAQDTKRILIPLRSEWVQEPNTWGTWGGAIDRGENPKQAIIRELEEEAGYNSDVLDTILLYTYKDDDFRYDTFVIVVPTEFEPKLNWETKEAQWVDFGDWPTPLHYGLESVLKDGSAMNKLGMITSD